MLAVPKIIVEMEVPRHRPNFAVLVAPTGEYEHGEPDQRDLAIQVKRDELPDNVCLTLAAIGYSVRLFTDTSRDFAHVWKGFRNLPFDPRPNRVFLCQPAKRAFDKTFPAHPDHRALAALTTVSQQLNKKVKRDVVERAKVFSGDDANIDTRKMIEAIQSVDDFANDYTCPCLYMTIYAAPGGYDIEVDMEHDAEHHFHVPFMHVDWAVVAKAMPADRHLVYYNRETSHWGVVNSMQFRQGRPEIHGGGIIGSPFGMTNTREFKLCYFEPFGMCVDNYYNIARLIANFDVVYVKRDCDFTLPDGFCCLYQWGEGDFYQEAIMCDADGKYTAHSDERFLVVLRKVVPCGYFE